jgi:hypothetical protein
MTQKRRTGVLVSSLLVLMLALALAACGQPADTPAPEPADTPAPTAMPEEGDMGDNGEVSDDEIREPEGDIEAFWNSFDWADLTATEQEAWGVLGWDEVSWDEETTIPASEEADWAELSAEEQAAAESLGYDQESWDAAE